MRPTLAALLGAPVYGVVVLTAGLMGVGLADVADALEVWSVW